MIDFRSFEQRQEDNTVRLAHLEELARTNPAVGTAQVAKALAWKCLLDQAVDEPDLDDLLSEIVLPRGGRLLSLATWLAEHVEHDRGGYRLWGALSDAGVALRRPELARVPDGIEDLAEVLVGCVDMPMEIRLRAALQVLRQGGSAAPDLIRTYMDGFVVSHLWTGDCDHDCLESFANDKPELIRVIASTSGWPLRERVEAAVHLWHMGTADSLPVELLAATESGSEERWILLELFHAEESGRHEKELQPLRRRDGRRGALFAVEAAERAWGLGAVDPFLGSAVRRQLTASYELNGIAETDTQVADSASAMARVAVDYSELRQSLLRDSTHVESEPPWRTLRDGGIAVRMRRRLRHHEAFVLIPGSHAPSSRARSWTFTVLSRPLDPDSRATDFEVTLHQGRGDDGTVLYRVDAQRELMADEELVQQVLYGLSSLGLNLDPDVGKQCPGVGQRGRMIFREPSDEWHVECHVCGVRWAGGSDILSEHADRRYGFW
ncbi:hypothetical protein ACIA6T_35140 [Streptomyces sp. NPDC051740]|uniref:hypothetical protein n=1 Tax=Streptomyces sp. NPDC051740 TaxID=3365673 RepID=UPI00378D39E0